MDFGICILAGIAINFYDMVSFNMPLVSLFSLFTGCIIAGFFIGLDSALNQERLVIENASKQSFSSGLPKRYFPMTRKFTLVAITASVFVALVLILVFTRDVEWLVNLDLTEQSLYDAQMSVVYEILFIVAVLMLLIVNLIFSFSRNLQLLFNNETMVLEKVQGGDLTRKVPVATHDEFGVIAGHTNHMIDGLRHRFELITALQLAEEVQQNLLPETGPNIDNYDIFGNSIYCEQTGGDYFDYFNLPDQKLGIVVADACGHGVGAALLMSSVRAYMKSSIRDYQGPALLCDQINKFLTTDCSKTSRFTSMFFLELDRANKQISWVRAGHEPALVYYREKDTFAQLDGSGLVLGIEQDYPFEQYSTSDLTSGDIIFIGTDGIRETQNEASEFFGEQRLMDIIRRNASDPAESIQKKIVEATTVFRGEHPQEDDITLVIIKIL